MVHIFPCARVQRLLRGHAVVEYGSLKVCGRHEGSSQMKVDPAEIDHFRKTVLSWGRKNLRTYSWRNGLLDPFGVLIAEVLLVRTRADAVEKVVLEFVGEFGEAESLSNANIKSVELLLRPLGLHRKRAKALVQMARVLLKDHGGLVPQELDSLLALPYVGRYTANAALCFAFGERRAIVDANIARLMERYFGLAPPVGKLDENDLYWDLASQLLPYNHIKTYNWALLDLGGLICVKHKPLCSVCPFSEDCVAHNRGNKKTR